MLFTGLLKYFDIDSFSNSPISSLMGHNLLLTLRLLFDQMCDKILLSHKKKNKPLEDLIHIKTWN